MDVERLQAPAGFAFAYCPVLIKRSSWSNTLLRRGPFSFKVAAALRG
jgi:hypothetical protein